MSERPLPGRSFSGRVPLHEPFRETAGLYALAGLGAIEGVYKYYLKPSPGVMAWGVLIGGVVAYDMLCPKGQTLSETVDVALEKHKLATAAVIGATALHLLNVIPEKWDPIHQLTMIGKS